MDIMRELDTTHNNATLINTLSELVDESSLYNHTEQIFESDRMSNFTAYNNTAAWLKQTMLDYGLDEVELEELPADGKTLFSDWIAPLAWDVNEAWLEVNAPNGEAVRLCDYARLPDTIIMGSEPTQNDGIQARLINIDELDLTKENIEGCIALTARKACDVKKAVHDAGGKALVSFFHPFPDEDPDSVYWNNCWGDRRGGWWQTHQDCRLAGFSLSPNQGADLQQRLAAGEEIIANAFIDGRVYEGTLPFVTGRIAGTDAEEEEILVLSHLYEHGAHDNATGSSTNLEIARAIAAGIRSGVIERPKRSLRFLFMAECYGTIAYGQYRSERMKMTKAAISLDGVGAAWPLNVHREADIARSPLGPLIAAVAKEVYKQDKDAEILTVGVEVSDTLLADPVIGVPTAWPHRASKKRTWHTSLDTMDKIEPKQMKGMALTVAATLLRFASLSPEDATYISRLCADQGLENLHHRPAESAVLEHEKNAELAAIEMINQFAFADNGKAVDDVVKTMKEHFNNLADTVISNILDSHPSIAEAIPSDSFSKELPKHLILNRNSFGHISLDPISDEEFEKTHIGPRWSPWQIAAYWWIDGKRSVGEIYERMYGEFQISLKALTDYFLELKKFGYIQTEE